MGQIIVYALLSAVYPTLIAATTVMLLLPRAEGLMVGFWFGAMITSVTCGLVVVFALGGGSSTVNTTRHTISPVLALVGAVLLVIAAVALAKGEDQRLREHHRERHPHKKGDKPPKWQQKLQDGNPWHAFVVGILLSFPGVWYLAALDRLIKLDYSTLTETIVVVAFCLFQLILIEVPMLAFRIWPAETPKAIDRAKAWASAHGRRLAVWGLAVIAGLLAVVGAIGLFT